MDSLVFIATLGVAAVVIHWYVANEIARDNGGRGLFALRDGTEKSESAALPETKVRYRQKSRLAPAQRTGMGPAQGGKAFRPASSAAYIRADVSESASEDDY